MDTAAINQFATVNNHSSANTNRAQREYDAALLLILTEAHDAVRDEKSNDDHKLADDSGRDNTNTTIDIHHLLNWETPNIMTADLFQAAGIIYFLVDECKELMTRQEIIWMRMDILASMKIDKSSLGGNKCIKDVKKVDEIATLAIDNIIGSKGLTTSYVSEG